MQANDAIRKDAGSHSECNLSWTCAAFSLQFCLQFCARVYHLYIDLSVTLLLLFFLLDSR